MSRESSVPRATYADERTSPAVGPAAGTASGSAVSTPSTGAGQLVPVLGRSSSSSPSRSASRSSTSESTSSPNPWRSWTSPACIDSSAARDGLVEPALVSRSRSRASAMVWSSRWAEAICVGRLLRQLAPSPARSRPLLPRPRRPRAPRSRCRCGARPPSSPARSGRLARPPAPPRRSAARSPPSAPGGPPWVSLMASANRLCATASWTIRFHGSPSVKGSMRSGRGSRGTAAATRPPHATIARAMAAGTLPTAKPTAAPAPASMPSGDVIARATGGVKNRSRNERLAIDARLREPLARKLDRGQDLVDRRGIGRL